MTESLIPEFQQKLSDYKNYFIGETNGFLNNIRVSTERFTQQDREDFNDALEEIREFAETKLFQFINTRVEKKTVSFTRFFEGLESSTDNLTTHLNDFRVDLEEASRRLKEKEVEGEALLERITTNYAKAEALKKGFRAFKANAEESLKEKKIEAKMVNHFQKRLMSKCFFPWRALTYKDGYENSVKRQTEVQLRKIHTEFGSILQVLKQKIAETEELIKTKRAAKGEFAYALSKNLLKTISNLSLEVMSLNQVSAKDKQSQNQTENFLNEVNRAINARLQTVTLYKESLYESRLPARQPQIQRQEPRQIPNRVLSPRSRGKRITFA